MRASIPASSISASSWAASKGMGGGAAVALFAPLKALAGVAIASMVFSPIRGRGGFIAFGRPAI